jgi:hypothetical protein
MSNVKFEVGKQVDTTGTSKRGTVDASYQDIVRVFGEPTYTDSEDSYVEWAIKFNNTPMVVATIYDMGFKADPRRDQYESWTFNVGGNNMYAPYYVHTLLGK